MTMKVSSASSAVCASTFVWARARTSREAAEQLGHGKAEDQPIKGEEEAELVDAVPRVRGCQTGRPRERGRRDLKWAFQDSALFWRFPRVRIRAAESFRRLTFCAPPA